MLRALAMMAMAFIGFCSMFVSAACWLLTLALGAITAICMFGVAFAAFFWLVIDHPPARGTMFIFLTWSAVSFFALVLLQVMNQQFYAWYESRLARLERKGAEDDDLKRMQRVGRSMQKGLPATAADAPFNA